MNDQQNPGSGDNNHNHPALPLEPGSEAILFSASHLFVIEVTAMRATPWARDAGGLEHRSLHLELRLIEKMKGAFRGDGGTFAVDVAQQREDALTVSDYHGFWSHKEIEQGKKYLVASNGSGANLRELMQEPSIKALFDAALVEDVKLAMTAEQHFGSKLQKSSNGERLAAARDLLKFAQEHRTTVDQLFSQYLWDRIGPVYAQDEESIEPAVMALIEAPDSTIPLREALVYGAYDAVISSQPTPAQSRLLRALLELLLQPQASAMFDRMLQVPIYNLAFPNGRPPLVAAGVVGMAADRTRMAAVAAGFPSSRAKAVAAWLAGQ